MYRTSKQNRRLHHLFAKLNIDADTKADLIQQFTQKRTSKSSLMLYNECNNLIKSLEDQEYNRIQERVYDKELQELRRKVFKLMYELSFITNSETNERKLYVINQWLIRKANLNKELNDLSALELNKVITQLYAVRRVYRDKEKTESTWN